MSKKLWQKDIEVNKLVEQFTVGKDKEFDLLLAEHDLIASRAHAQMLEKVKLISKDDLKKLLAGLDAIEKQIEKGKFKIEEGVEDVHSQIEMQLTKMAGEAGKKIHLGRSRNDQVLTAMKLYLRNELTVIANQVGELFAVLIQQSKQHKNVLLPGYTHLQIAMPSSFGLWLSAYAESLCDDMELLIAAYAICNKNPLGSAAGYGSSFPIDRQYTTEILGFDQMNVSSVYAQMTRGKSEKAVSIALASIAHTLSKFAYDVCLYMSQNFGFISFPEELTTGSSIMPHKKNPDVFELVRGKCNVIQGIPNQLTLLTNNLPSGYHRDMQLTKEVLFPAIQQLKDCLQILAFALPQMKVNKNILGDSRYAYLYSVDAVNEHVKKGVSFRDAYKKIGLEIQQGKFKTPSKLKHTHIGSIDNPGIELIEQQFRKALQRLNS
ncbi:MAG TPA: argininosuccinate lyase [Bacteroidia bacterium]|nr:argininosuccinate lyase [Bacteroidia bacterium]